MDAYEATKVVMSRIQSLDPENASKIMGYILIQDQGEKEVIRLAFGPEALLLPYINDAKAYLGLGSSSPSSPLSNPTNPFPPGLRVSNNGLHLSNPSSPAAVFQRPCSYAAALNGSAAGDNSGGYGSPSSHFCGGGDFAGHQAQYQFPFLDDSAADPAMSPSGRSDSLAFRYGEDLNCISSPHAHPLHRRSCSVNDAAFLLNLEEGRNGGGFGPRPCMYFARGHCKNGSSCKFLHGGDIGGGADAVEVGSPVKNSTGFDELLRMKALQQHRHALMSHHPFPFNKCLDLLNENPRSNFNGFRSFNFQRPERNGFSPVGLFGCGGNSSSRQIYLTFPADSSFSEEDVSNYFSTFGPVQDVRIPHQQKRMFGFVTFHYSETVKIILAKGNPHFVCDSRVLVKPYKEKGQIQEKKQLQKYQIDRVEHPSCLCPPGLDSRDIDLPLGSRVLFRTQEMILRRKMEQEAELQHAIGLQCRRMMNLQMMDLENQQHIHPFLRSGAAVASPRESQLFMNQSFTTTADITNQEASADSLFLGEDKKLEQKDKNFAASGDDSELPESLEHILPDNLFASPTKSASENQHTAFSQASVSAVTASYNNNHPLIMPNTSPLAMASLKSCYLQMPSH